MRILIMLAFFCALAGCGFRPLYATGAQSGAAIGPVVIDRIEGKSGHVLKTELDLLLDLERGSGPIKRLSIRLTESFGLVGLRVDEASSRADLRLAAAYTLFDDQGKELLRGVADSVASYEVPASSYGGIAAQNDARERAAELLAERIRAEIALRLARG